MTPREPQAGIMRALGLVAGDLWKVVTGRRPAFRQGTVVRRDVEEREVPTADGKVVLRRTTVEEVEVQRTGAPPLRPHER